MICPSACFIFTWLPLRCTSTKPSRVRVIETCLPESSGSFTQPTQRVPDLRQVRLVRLRGKDRSLHGYFEAPLLLSFLGTNSSSAKERARQSNHSRPVPR